jgi:glyoxylase-like metal-dependent hydrolase (beta-lactamase superfamily II)
MHTVAYNVTMCIRVPRSQSAVIRKAHLSPKLLHHPHGITAVDTEYLQPGHAASHIIQDAGRAAFVDVGTNYSVPHLLAALDVLGIARDTVDYLFLTHVHMDHVGGAGRLMQELPNARAVLHPRGAPHVIEPDKLIAGSKVVYGEERFRKLYGDLVPIPTARVRVAQDGERYRLGARELELIHTPGHALHHYAVVDAAHASIFPGDTFGISYRETDSARGAFITPTTSPTQFDPEQLIASIDRMSGYAPEAMYLMHFSRVTDVPRLAESLKTQIRELVRIAQRHASAQDRYTIIRADMLGLWLGLAHEHGVPLSDAQISTLLRGDLDLNTQGLIVWLDRLKRS